MDPSFSRSFVMSVCILLFTTLASTASGNLPWTAGESLPVGELLVVPAHLLQKWKCALSKEFNIAEAGAQGCRLVSFYAWAKPNTKGILAQKGALCSSLRVA